MPFFIFSSSVALFSAMMLDMSNTADRKVFMQVSFFVEVKTCLMYLLCLILPVIMKGLRTIFFVVCLLERVTPISSCDFISFT